MLMDETQTSEATIGALADYRNPRMQTDCSQIRDQAKQQVAQLLGVLSAQALFEEPDVGIPDLQNRPEYPTNAPLSWSLEKADMGFSEFTRERQFLSNVTPSTLEWYKHSFKWLDSDSPSQEDLKAAVVRMRTKGLKATGCNAAIRAINTSLHWANAESEVKCGPTCKHPKIAQLKEPQLVLPTFTEQQIRQLVARKPKGTYQERLHLLTLFLLDTGCRISKALTLRISEIDFENLLVQLDGKGAKQRVVP
jgi:integrase